MPDHGGPTDDGRDSPSSHRKFVRLYETFQIAAYDACPPPLPGKGRQRFAEQLRAELQKRGATQVLDCAAGTGFPALLLARNPWRSDFEIHCTDGDPWMLDVLLRRAHANNLDLERLVPPPNRRAAGSADITPADLLLNWQDLDQIDLTYDYVMCRGNSLAYDNSWAGETDVAPLSQVARHLERIADRVRPGGWLHVDAPWEIGLGGRTYESADARIASIHEQVTTHPTHRPWRLVFHHTNGHVDRFNRYSSLLTIGDLKQMLEHLGFNHTRPFQLGAERPNYGVIIARRPR